MLNRRQGHLKEVSPGCWHVRLTVGRDAGGKRVRLNKTVRGSKAKAQRYLNAAIRRKDDGLEVVLTKQSLGEWVEEWLGTWCSSISARTRSDYQRILRRYLPVDLRTRQLPLIRASEVQRFVNELSDPNRTPRRLSPRTVRMAHGALRACLNRALRLGKIPRNVSMLVELPKNTHKERLCLTQAEASRLVYAPYLDKQKHKWNALFAILVQTGIRPGEALGLQWSDIDNGVLRVRRALVVVPGQLPQLSATKTGRARAVPLGTDTREILTAHRLRQVERKLKLGPNYEDHDLIFANDTGGFADLHNIASRCFKPLLEDLGLPRIRLYDLRHSSATLMLASGEHPKVVQERLGHASITLTLDTYTHVLPTMQEMASQRLEALLRLGKEKEA